MGPACAERDFAETRLQELRSSVQHTDAPLARLFERYGDAAVYNHTRRAVQVACAEGSIVASMPLTAAQLKLLGQ